jgi:hypothetical protein
MSQWAARARVAGAGGNRRIKKEAFRRGEEGFFLFRGLSWSQGPKRKRFFGSYPLAAAGVSHAAGALGLTSSSWSSSSSKTS